MLQELWVLKAQNPGGAPGPPQEGTTRKLKLSAILDPTLHDPTLDAEVIPIQAQEQTALYDPVAPTLLI